MTISITDTINGFIITKFTPEEELKFEKYVVERLGETDVDEVDAFVKALSIISDLIGPDTGKYSEKRVHITTLPGKNYDNL